MYGLFEPEKYRPSYIGTLIAGLAKPTIEQVLMATCADRLGNIVWMFSEDGKKGINKPKSILKILMGETEENDIVGYDSPEEFLEAMKKYG